MGKKRPRDQEQDHGDDEDSDSDENSGDASNNDSSNDEGLTMEQIREIQKQQVITNLVMHEKLRMKRKRLEDLLIPKKVGEDGPL